MTFLLNLYPGFRLLSGFRFSAIGLMMFALFCFTGCRYFSESTVIIDRVNTVRTEFGSKWAEPFGLASKDGKYYVGDGQSGRIFRFADGKTEVFAKGLDTPSLMEFDESGNLVVADSGDHTIKSIDENGIVSVIAGKKDVPGFKDGDIGEARFRGPVGVAVSGGKIFVSDTYNDRIRVIENGQVSTIAGGQRGYKDGKGGDAEFDTPLGIDFQDGTLLVADFGNRLIRSVSEDAAVITVAGGGGESLGLPLDVRLRGVVDIDINERGAVIFSDGHEIKAIGARFVSFVERVAGKERGFRDDSLKTARFNRPSGVLALNGSVLVADSENGLVRVLSDDSVGQRIAPKEFLAGRPTIEEFKAAGPARWPYEPPGKTREIAGTLGEIRGEISDESDQAWFHNGLDITGGFGEKAHVIREEKVLLPLAVNEYETLRENLRLPQLGYIHISLGRDQQGNRFNDNRFLFDEQGLRIPRGTKFRPGDILGTLNRMNHVHLIAGASGREWNALAALKLPGVSDSRTPVISAVSVNDELYNGESLVLGPSRTIKVTAEIVDQMDGNAARRKLGIYRVGYAWINGTSAETEAKPIWTIRFFDSPENDLVPVVYDVGSRSGATGTTTFRYIVSNKVDGKTVETNVIRTPTRLGSYTLRIFAADYFGEIASKDIIVEVK